MTVNLVSKCLVGILELQVMLDSTKCAAFHVEGESQARSQISLVLGQVLGGGRKSE